MYRFAAIAGILLALFLLCQQPTAQAAKYVADTFKITMRTGPGPSNKIIKMLPSGTRLEQIGETKNWLQVRTPDGKEGWVMKRYIMDSTPKELIIEDLNRTIDKLKGNAKENQETIASLRQENQELKSSLSETQEQLSEISGKYDSLKKDAGEVMTIKENYQTTKQNLASARQELSRLKKENEKLRDEYSMHWFLSGAGTVIVASLMGFLLGRVQRKKSRKVYF